MEIYLFFGQVLRKANCVLYIKLPQIFCIFHCGYAIQFEGDQTKCYNNLAPQTEVKLRAAERILNHHLSGPATRAVFL